MQINRLFEIVYLLMEKKTMTAKELAEHFEVSARTILRDVGVLSSAGIPVYTSQGKGGGISLLDGYVLHKAMFSEGEQKSILFALQGMAAAQNIETQPAISKLKSIFATQNTDWIEVDFSRWGSREEDKKKFELIKAALLGREALAFFYSNACGQTAARKVYPLKLMFKAMAWYLYAWCTQKEGYRVFKITRMQNIERTREYFEAGAFLPPEEKNGRGEPPDFYGGKNPKEISLKLIFPPGLAYRVYDDFDEKAITRGEDGFFTVTAAFPDGEWLFDYLLSFGADVEVAEPPEIRARMARTAQKIMQKHTDQT